MSDCSAAMKPNERRTCGTCKHVNAVWLDCMFAASDSSYYMRCTRPDVGACEHHVDDPDSLPRRYERLAQVAREMYAALRTCTYGCSGGCLMLNDGCDVDTGILGVRLEALGVSVDD